MDRPAPARTRSRTARPKLTLNVPAETYELCREFAGIGGVPVQMAVEAAANVASAHQAELQAEIARLRALHCFR